MAVGNFGQFHSEQAAAPVIPAPLDAYHQERVDHNEQLFKNAVTSTVSINGKPVQAEWVGHATHQSELLDFRVRDPQSDRTFIGSRSFDPNDPTKLKIMTKDGDVYEMQHGKVGLISGTKADGNTAAPVPKDFAKAADIFNSVTQSPDYKSIVGVPLHVVADDPPAHTPIAKGGGPQAHPKP